MTSRLLPLIAVLAFPAFSTPFGSAGCGLGAYFFAERPGKTQIVAATTNNLPSQALTMTCGTSGCNEDLMVASDNFIRANDLALRGDIARGKGETLAALFHHWGCSKTETLGTKLQSQYQKIFPTEETPAENIRASLNQVLKGHCFKWVS